MLVYYLIPSLILLFSVKVKNENFRITILSSLVLCLFVFVAFRKKTGCDWTGYQLQLALYNELGPGTLLFEPVWSLLLHFTNFLNGDIMLLNVFSALIFFSGALHLSRKSENPFLFYFMLFPILIIGLAMSGIRQATAIGFLMSSFAYSLSNQKVKSYLLLIFAVCTHISSVIIIPILLYSSKKFKFDKKLIISSLLIFIGLSGITIYFWHHIVAGISRYYSGEIISAGAIFRIGILVFLLTFMAFLRRAKNITSTFIRVLNVTQLYSIALLILGLFSSVIADRLLYNILPFHAYLLASSTSLVSVNKKIIIVVSIVIYFSLFIYWSINSYFFKLCYTPYESYLLDIF